MVKARRCTDFVKLAEAYGARGFRTKTMGDFSITLKKALASDVTTVIDVPISPEENVFPWFPCNGVKGYDVHITWRQKHEQRANVYHSNSR